MKRLDALYKKYPKNPKEFSDWRAAVNKEISEVNRRFKKGAA